MSVSVYPTYWPTEGSLDDISDKAFGDAHRSLEDLVLTLQERIDHPERPGFEDPTPETVGVVWSCLSAVQTDLDEMGSLAGKLEKQLHQIDAWSIDRKGRKCADA